MALISNANVCTVYRANGSTKFNFVATKLRRYIRLIPELNYD